MAKNLKATNTVTTVSFGNMDPNDLKGLIRDGLMVMTIAEREEFIRGLAEELRREGVKMTAYLVPLGIPGRSAEDLTPTEVGHLVRFLKINVPRAISAVERVLGRYGVFAEKAGDGRRLAA